MVFPADVERVERDVFVVNGVVRVERVESNWFSVSVPGCRRRDFQFFREAVAFAREETFAPNNR